MRLTLMKLLLTGLMAGILCFQANGQSFDYSHRPAFEYSFREAEIDLQVNPDERTLSGSVQYTVEANIAAAGTLTVNAPGIRIDSVRSAGEQLGFEQRNGTLRISLADSAVAGQQYRFEIFYRASPLFGLLTSSEGTLWTSMLPLAARHWLPVRDHPRVAVTASLTLRYPASFVSFASGVKTDDETLADGSKMVTYRTSRPVPVTSLAFGLGQFRESGSSVGIKRINSYAEAKSVSPSVQARLLGRARLLLNTIEQQTGREYPYQRLNLVILNDHYWEQKPYGATTIFLYTNRGALEAQLRRGLYAQWFGVYRHEEQWASSWPVFYLQTALHRSLAERPALAEADAAEPEMTFSTVYDQFSAERWNHWQRYEGRYMQEIARTLIPQLLDDGGGTLTPDAFSDAWYRLSGQPGMEIPDFGQAEGAAAEAVPDTVRYRVDYKLDESAGRMIFVFDAREGVLPRPVTLPVDIITAAGDNRQEITVSGPADSASISIPAGTRNVRLYVPEGRLLALEEHKPVPYLLYQLRNADSSEARRAAARQLGYHTDNPDLQLALNDFMEQTMEPEVEAALLHSYGAITKGAEGTEQRFIAALQNDSPAIRAAAMEVLDNYPGRQVTERLRTHLQEEPNDTLSSRAMELYMQRIDSVAALQYTNRLVQQDTAGTRAIQAIAILAEKGRVAKAVELASYYLEPVYAYPVRRRAFRVLLEYDDAAGQWAERVDMLLSDPDPRMRFITVKNIASIPGIDPDERISSRMPLEDDARVYRLMRNRK